MHALPGVVLGHLAQLLQRFQERYPKIVLDMVVNDSAIDPVKEGFDCTLQIFPPGSEELVSHKLFPVRRIFCATPGYVHRHGLPRHPRDLAGHRLGWYSGYPIRERLAFHGSKEIVQLAIKPVLLTNSVHLLREYAMEDAAIVCNPTLVAADDLLAGDLQLVLGDHPLSSFWLSVFYPVTVRSAAQVPTLSRHAEAEFRWHAALGSDADRARLGVRETGRIARRILRNQGLTRSIVRKVRIIKSTPGPCSCSTARMRSSLIACYAP